MDLELRPLTPFDAPVMAAAFRALGWPGKTEEDYAAYFARQQPGELVVWYPSGLDIAVPTTTLPALSTT